MQVLKKATPWARWEEEDDGELPELPWKKAASCAALPDLEDGNHAHAAYKAPVSVVSPPMIKPKSYATVAKASVVTAARPQPAAVPKLRVAASMPSADLKPSATAGKPAAHKVNACTWHVHKCATCAAFPNCCCTLTTRYQ